METDNITIQIEKRVADFIKKELNVDDLTPQAQQLFDQWADHFVSQKFNERVGKRKRIDEKVVEIEKISTQ